MTTHRKSRTPEYLIWATMLARCQRKTAHDFDRYGGRGIRVCERWHDFSDFLADVGLRPSKNHSLDRINNDGNYEPSNVRWATLQEQANNKRTTHFVEYDGQRMSIADAARAAGSLITRESAARRIRDGWDVKLAVETPYMFRREPETRKIIRECAA